MDKTVMGAILVAIVVFGFGRMLVRQHDAFNSQAEYRMDRIDMASLLAFVLSLIVSAFI